MSTEDQHIEQQQSEELTAQGKPAEARAGVLLRQAREQAGMHIAALAVSLKVPVAKLEALEQGRLEALPDLTFARALASAVCRHLKLDPSAVLELLPSSNSQPLPTPGQSLNTPFHKPGDPITFAEGLKKIRITLVAVFLIAVAALVLYFLPGSWLASSRSGDITQQVVNPPAVLPPANPVSATEIMATTTTATLPVEPSTTQVTATPQEIELLFRAESESWIEVLQQNGPPVMRSLLKAGDSQTIKTTVPVTVSIGNAGKTTVAVQGKPYDLHPVTKDNVARFTLN